MFKFQECLSFATKEAKKIFGEAGDFTTKELRRAASAIKKQVNHITENDKYISYGGAMDQALDNYIATRTDEVLRKERAKKLNILINEKNKKIVDSYGKHPDKGLVQKMGGLISTEKGSRSGVYQVSNGTYAYYMHNKKTGILGALREQKATYENYSNLLDILFDKKNEVNSMKGIAGEKTIHTDFDRIGEFIRNNSESRRLRINSLGGDIKKLKGRVFKRINSFEEMLKTDDNYIKDTAFRATHSADECLEKSFDRWYSFINPMVDNEETFRNYPEDSEDPLNSPKLRESVFKDIYRSILENVPKSVDEIGRDINSESFFNQEYHPGKVKSLHRVIILKDAESNLAYQKKMGGRGLTESLMSDVITDTRNIAILEEFGPSYKLNYRRMVDYTKSKLGDKNIKGKTNKLSSAENMWKDYMDTTSGNQMFRSDRVHANIRTLYRIPALKLVAIKSIPDIATGILSLKRNGRNIFEAVNQMFTGTIKHLISGGKAESVDVFNKALGIGTRDLRGSMMRFSLDNPTGIIKRVEKVSNILNFIHFWDNGQKYAVASPQASLLASCADLEFEQINPRTRLELSKFNLGQDWDYLRKNAIRDIGNTAMMMPDYVDNPEIAARFYSYYDDLEKSVIYGSDTPLENALLKASKRHRGTTFHSISAYHLRKYFLVFKSWGIKLFTDTMAREIYGSNISGLSKISNIAQFMAISMTLGYFGECAASFAENKTTPDITKKSVMLRTMLSPLGILSSFISSNSDQYEIIGRMAGYPAEVANDIRHLFSSKHKLKYAFDPIKKLIPDSAVTYALLKYFFYNHLSEMMDPGSVHRSQRWLRKETGQKTLFGG